MQARSLYLTAPRRVEWVEEALPQPGPGEVLLWTTAGAISIGTELARYRGAERRGYERPLPVMTGYESLGIVTAIGDGVTGLAPGDRALAFYGHRTAALVPAAKAIPVAPDIGDALALLAILGCDVVKGVRKLQPRPDEPVLITGAGTIGLLAVWSLRALGVETVDVVEPNASRRELALALGARQALDPTDGDQSSGYAVGLECSSRDAAFHLLQRWLRPQGRICVLADGNIEPLTLAPAFHMQELTVIASSDGWDYHQHAAWHFDVIRSGCSNVERIFEHHVSADDLPAAFEAIAAGEINPVKVFVRY
ncbi:MAG TPA: zinc-binding dehydrogenase [Thermomicrobiales bacterium]|nr:zinc-binding dehydrogenase [Thermomicrobiales bacterium]